MDATFDHIGVVWWIGGDDDLDSAFNLEYRLSGDAIWHPAAPAVLSVELQTLP